MKVLVTGGAGFIGSHVIESLAAEGNRVTAVDNFDAFYARALKQANIQSLSFNRNFTFVEADIRNEAELEAKLNGNFDSIVHLAAKAGVRPSIENPHSYQEVNVAGTQNMLELAKRWGVKQFVFASSSSVYGVNPNVPWKESDHVLQPISPYASTKVSGELLGHVYSHLYGIRFIALRFFTVYGPRQRPDLAIHKFSRMILNGEQIPVFGGGTTRRDYTYVDDVVSAIRSGLSYAESKYEVINIGNNVPIPLNELISTIENAIGSEAKIKRLPEQAGDVPQTYADINKARQLLDYEPRTRFKSGIETFVKWLRAQRSDLAPMTGGGSLEHR